MNGQAQDAAGESVPRAGRGSLFGRLIRVRETGLVIVIAVLFAVMSFASPYFLTWENMRAMTMAFAVEGIVVVGMTILLISGGIDLSVGAVIALTTMVSAALVERHGWSPLAVIPLVLAMGTVFGAFMGFLIERFRLQPFIVTLAGMFLARGLCYLISIDSISITNAFYTEVAQIRIPVWGDASISISAIIAIVVMLAAVFIAHCTAFGRAVYAVGGSEHSAMLMGLPVRRTLIGVYTLSGFCSALAGVIFTFYMLSGYGLHAVGLELDAIAAVVIGGTLLTGGVGYVAGTLFGALMLGIIQTLISFDGSLSSWWTRIVVGALLFVFCLLQRFFTSRAPLR